MNFDFNTLFLINPCELGDDCYARAMHATSIIDNAQIFSSFQEAVKGIDFLVATSSIDTRSDKKHLRKTMFLPDFSKKIYEIEGEIGLVFGREDYGLFNEEIALCDVLVKIPTSDRYPSLNLSHAVTLVLFYLYIERAYAPRKQRPIGKIEKEHFFDFFSKLLESIEYPVHKKEKTEIMVKRIMGRAMLSKWEYHTLMGVLGKTLEKVTTWKKGR